MTHLAKFYPGDEVVLYLVRIGLQVTAVLAVVVLANAILFRKRPAVRHLLGVCGLTFVLVSPILGLVLDLCDFPYWTVATTRGATPASHGQGLALGDRSMSPVSLQGSERQPLGGRSDPADVSGPRVTEDAPEQTVPSIGFPLRPRATETASDGRLAAGMLIALWLVGAAVTLVRRLRGAAELRRMLARASRVTDAGMLALLREVSAAAGLRRIPQLKVCVQVTTPCAVGIRTPAIVLPTGILSRVSGPAVRDVLTHEAAHLARGDLWIGLCQTFGTIIYWLHPLIHVLNRQLGRAREELCDNHVLQARSAPEYAQTLLDLSLLCRPPRLMPAFGLLAPAWDLRARVAGILDERRSRTTRLGRRRLAAALTLAALAGLLVAFGDPSGGKTFGPLKAEDGSMRAVLRGKVVDEQNHPVAGAAVRFTASEWYGTATAETDAKGEFELPARRAPVQLRLLATKDERAATTLRGYFTTTPEEGRTNPVVIVLKPEHLSRVKVVDGAGSPVPQADVRAYTIWADDIAFVVSNDQGEAVLRLPVDAMVQSVSASKPGVGLDYYENYRAIPQTSFPPLPDEIRLQLDGARRVEVRVVDSTDNPIPGVKLAPWTIKRPGKLRDLNLSGGGLAVVTDARGVARFETIPGDVIGEVEFLVLDDRLHCPDPPTYRPDEDKGPIAAKVLRNARVRGRVINGDGKPAAGIIVQGEGRGNTHHYFREYAQTHADGSFAMWVYPQQTCLFTVTDHNRASNTVMGRLFAEEEEAEGIDLRLVQGTLIHGRITREAEDGPPAGGKYVALAQKGTPHKLGPLWNQADRVELARMCVTDERGEYRFRVGPGEYTLTLPGNPYVRRVPLKVTDETEIRNDGIAAASRRRVAGQILDRANTPAAQAIVWARPAEQLGASLQVLADREGRFEADGWQQKILLYARSADGRKAAFGAMPVADATAELLLRPAARIVGVVRRRDGTSAVNAGVRALLWHPDTVVESGGNIADVSTTADKEGRYTLSGLPIGARVQLSSNPDKDLPQSVSGGIYTVVETGVIEAADIRAQAANQALTTAPP